MAQAPSPLLGEAAKRSKYLADALAEMGRPKQIQGYGELGTRLLARALIEGGKRDADKAAAVEESNKDLARRQGIAAQVGATIEGTAQEVPKESLNPFSAFSPLANALRGRGQPEPVAAPQAPAQAPAPAMMPTNTQEPVSSSIAPVAPVQGAPLPEQAPMQAAPAQPAPQMQQPAPEQNPLAATPQERQMIVSDLNSGDPERVARAEQRAQEIQLRQAQPAALRQEYQEINGVPGVVDPVTRQWTAIDGGVPQQAMNQTQVAGPDNTLGLRVGTVYTLSPQGDITVIDAPQAGFQSDGQGGYVPIRGSREDIGGNPTARFQAIQSVRAEVKPILDQATSLNRNIQAVRAGLRAQNGAGDIAVINGLQKLIDEGVVREGDVALQLRAQGINGGIAGLEGFLRSSGTFSPEIRSQLGSVAEDIYRNMTPLYREQVMGRRDFVERTFGPGSFDDVISPSARQAYGWEPSPSERREAPSRSSQAAPARQQPATPRGNSREGVYNPATGRIEWR